MYEWNQAVQVMIEWAEEHLSEQELLLGLSKRIGYSPCYCSSQFHAVAGMTLRSYVAGRRLARATLDIRDTGERILDIAIKYGYSSQEALTRAFVGAYGCTPAAYRKNPRPVSLLNMRTVLFPEYYQNKGDPTMNETCLTTPRIRMEYIPAHRYVGIWSDKAAEYGGFWEEQNCDEVCGTIESMRHVSHPVVGCHTAGWRRTGGQRKYFYGLGVNDDYTGNIPKGFEVREFPGSYYLVFFHPAYDFLKDNDEVMSRVEKLAWNYDLDASGFENQRYQWNEESCQDYQRHCPETFGYEVLRPVRKK